MKRCLWLLVVCCMVAALSVLTPLSATAGALTVAVDSPPRTMDPHGSSADSNYSVMANLFDPLFQRVDGELKPALALRFEHPDALTWKFFLRQGIKFQNGNAFNAADVKFSFERLADPEVSEMLNYGKSIASIDIIDDYTVVIKTKQPRPWFANLQQDIFMMDKESTESRDRGDISTRPNGTGAYKLVEWVKGSYLKLAANEDYWEGAPPIKNVTIRPITESSTRYAALASGAVELVSGVPIETYARVKKDPKLQVISVPARRTIFLTLTNKPGTPMADVRVRKAMAMAINEEEIIAKIMWGHATPATQMVDPAVVGFNPEVKRHPYDPEGAKKLLKEAGYENGFEITLGGTNDRYIQDEKILEAVAKYLAKVGITCKVEAKPKAIFFPEVPKNTYDFYLIGWIVSSYDLSLAFFMNIHTWDEESGDGAWNGARWSDKEMDRLLNSTSTMSDLKERERTLQKLSKMVHYDQVALIPLHYQVNIYAIQKTSGLQFKPRSDRWLVYKEMLKN